MGAFIDANTDDSLFFVCHMLERLSRRLNLTCSELVDIMGGEGLQHHLSIAELECGVISSETEKLLIKRYGFIPRKAIEDAFSEIKNALAKEEEFNEEAKILVNDEHSDKYQDLECLINGRLSEYLKRRVNMTTDVYYDLFKNVEQHTQELISDTEAGVLLYKTADEWRNTLYDIASIGYRKGSKCFARRIIKNNVPYDLLVGMVTGLSPSEVDKVKESIAQEEQGNALFESYEADDFYVSDASQLLNGSISASDFSDVTGVSRDEAERICNKSSEKCNDNESPVNALAYLKAAVRSYQITYRRFARMLLSCSMSIEDVRKLTSLPRDEIERIKSELFLSEKEN